MESYIDTWEGVMRGYRIRFWLLPLLLAAGAMTPLALRMTIDPEELTLFDSEPMCQAFRAGTLFAATTGH